MYHAFPFIQITLKFGKVTNIWVRFQMMEFICRDLRQNKGRSRQLPPYNKLKKIKQMANKKKGKKRGRVGTNETVVYQGISLCHPCKTEGRTCVAYTEEENFIPSLKARSWKTSANILTWVWRDPKTGKCPSFPPFLSKFKVVLFPRNKHSLLYLIMVFKWLINNWKIPCVMNGRGLLFWVICTRLQ